MTFLRQSLFINAFHNETHVISNPAKACGLRGLGQVRNLLKAMFATCLAQKISLRPFSQAVTHCSSK
jgi:hypothetical protein